MSSSLRAATRRALLEAPPARRHASSLVLATRALLVAASIVVVIPSWTPSSAQELLVSLSADEAVGALAVADDELVRHAPFVPALLGWPRATFAAHLGAGDALGLASFPGDVDAVCDRGTGVLASQRILFSLMSNELGVLDGDVVRLEEDGLLVEFPEAVFVDAIGSVDGDVDVDAFHVDADGTILFSLAEDEDSAVLDGDDPGVVKDGAVLELAPGATVATFVYTESQVDALVSAALGVATAMGDVKGVCRSGGEILFCVQSPSSDDGSVFGDAGGGRVLPGHQEADFGFGSAMELDALTVSPAPAATLAAASAQPAPGSDVVLTLSGGTPGDVYTLLGAYTLGPVLADDAGWGGIVLAPDAMLVSTLSLTPQLVLPIDGNGFASLSVGLPAALGAIDIVTQAVRWTPERRSTNPILIEVGQ